MNELKLPEWEKFGMSIGEIALFLGSFFRNLFRKPFEWKEFIRQCYETGYKSLQLVGITGFVLGFVLTLQSMPTMKTYGATGLVPSMVSISIVREIGPVIIGLICAGKISSGIGAELGSMRVTEQLDAMEVSGANSIQFLVVTRILACTIMVPLLTLISDALSLFGGYIASNLGGKVTMVLYFNKSFSSLDFSDLFQSTIKTIFFGFAIGFVGCFKGFFTLGGTESVGIAANTAVVTASLTIIIMDALAVQLITLFS
jgi:phospholipid/cholesterol/gamma-HCH transport system permease protein